MKYLPKIVLTLLFIMVINSPIVAQQGFSIGGGLLYDVPQSEIFDEIEPGFGFIGGLGYDFHDRYGAELGVFHTSHTFRLSTEGSAIREDKSEQNAIFIKGRAIPYRKDKIEVVASAGPAFYSIYANQRSESYITEYEEEFSGIGIITGLDLRYYATDNLAVSLYFIGNFVKYTKKTQNSLTVENPGGLPRGDSIGWGLSIFYRIGKP